MSFCPAPGEQSSNPAPQPIAKAPLRFRVRVFDPRFLASQIGVATEIQPAAKLGISQSLKPANQIREDLLGRWMISGGHQGRLVSKPRPKEGASLFHLHQAAESPLAFIYPSHLMFLNDLACHRTSAGYRI